MCFSSSRHRAVLQFHAQPCPHFYPHIGVGLIPTTLLPPLSQPHQLYRLRAGEWQLPLPTVAACLSMPTVSLQHQSSDAFWLITALPQLWVLPRTPLHTAASPCCAPCSELWGALLGMWLQAPPGSLPHSTECLLLTFISWGASCSPNI